MRTICCMNCRGAGHISGLHPKGCNGAHIGRTPRLGGLRTDRSAWLLCCPTSPPASAAQVCFLGHPQSSKALGPQVGPSCLGIRWVWGISLHNLKLSPSEHLQSDELAAAPEGHPSCLHRACTPLCPHSPAAQDWEDAALWRRPTSQEAKMLQGTETPLKRCLIRLLPDFRKMLYPKPKHTASVSVLATFKQADASITVA